MRRHRSSSKKLPTPNSPTCQIRAVPCLPVIEPRRSSGTPTSLSDGIRLVQPLARYHAESSTSSRSGTQYRRRIMSRDSRRRGVPLPAGSSRRNDWDQAMWNVLAGPARRVPLATTWVDCRPGPEFSQRNRCGCNHPRSRGDSVAASHVYHSFGYGSVGPKRSRLSRMSRVLVAGGCGFIGSHLVDRLLLRRDVSVLHVVDNLWTSLRPNLDHTPSA